VVRGCEPKPLCARGLAQLYRAPGQRQASQNRDFPASRAAGQAGGSNPNRQAPERLRSATEVSPVLSNRFALGRVGVRALGPTAAFASSNTGSEPCSAPWKTGAEGPFAWGPRC
jgi:hypothetical protein